MMLPHALDFMGYRCINLSEKLKGHTASIEEWKRYIADDPFELRRITYPLTEDSLVVDLGGYKGEWAMQIYCRYRCMIDIYEPHPVLAALIHKRFGNNCDIRVYPMALSDKHTPMDLCGDDIYASLHVGSGEINEVVVKKASDVFNFYYPGLEIDILKINIEGSEYEVLPDLIKNYDISTIKNIQIQFHKTVPDYAQKRALIQQCLSSTHIQNWCYDWMYENWTAKP